jgi:hypothetical protein
MNDLELSIIIQKELDLCNQKIKKYDKKYKPEKKEQIELLIQYLNEQLQLQHDESEDDVDMVDIDFNKKLLLDDIQTLNNYMNLTD